MNADQNSYAISAGHKETLESAQSILDAGGNAVDASIAAFLVSMVSEPCMSSPGGGGIALIKDVDNVIYSCDFFCQTPQKKIKKHQEHFYPVTIDFGETTEDFYIGAGTIAVPGAIAGIYAMHDRFGQIPLQELFQPAIEKAKQGTIVDKFQAYDIHLLENILNQSNHGKSLFFNKNGLKKEGDVIRFEKMADFFEVLSIEGQRLFYEGEIANSIAQLCKESGGHLSSPDLKDYKAVIGHPYHFAIRDFELYTSGFPSKGGPLIACFLDALDTKNIDEPLSQNHLSEIKQALKTAIELKKNRVKLASFLLNRFNMVIHEESSIKPGGTTHFSIQDKNGMAVSLTTSLGEGCGIWLENADIQLNNMLGEEALMENGFYNWRPNSRLMTMMTPTIVKNQNNWLITGSGGAGRIPFVLGQLVHYIFDLGINMDIATELPRVFYQNNLYEIEAGFDTKGRENENHWSAKSLFFGGTNSIYSNSKSLNAIADQRRFGNALFK